MDVALGSAAPLSNDPLGRKENKALRREFEPAQMGVSDQNKTISKELNSKERDVLQTEAEMEAIFINTGVKQAEP